jgi:hypothetical protein
MNNEMLMYAMKVNCENMIMQIPFGAIGTVQG